MAIWLFIDSHSATPFLGGHFFVLVLRICAACHVAKCWTYTRRAGLLFFIIPVS